MRHATTATLGENQRLEGIGSIGAPLIHHGTTAPGLGIGILMGSHPLTLTASSVFAAEVDGSGGDMYNTSSTIAIDGTLKVLYVNGFAPAGYWVRTIVDASGVSGRFDNVIVPARAPGLVTRVLYLDDQVIVGQSCASDMNLDGTLNFFDVSAFLNAFQSMNPSADLTGDGLINFFDVSALLNNFSGNCPL